MFKITLGYFSMFNNTPPTSWVEFKVSKIQAAVKILKYICKKTSDCCKFTQRGLCHCCCLGKILRLSGQITPQFWPNSLSNKEKTSFFFCVHRQEIDLKFLLPSPKKSSKFAVYDIVNLVYLNVETLHSISTTYQQLHPYCLADCVFFFS